MVESNIPEINVDEIMKKIREEVNKRKAGQSETDQQSSFLKEVVETSINPKVEQTKLWKAIKAIQFRFRRYPFYSFAYKTAFKFIQFIPKYQSNIDIEDLLKNDGETFIKNAYKVILQRDVDEHGLSFYLSMMRSGKLNKVQVLASLRYSKEGRAKRINIKNLYLSYVAIKFYKFPVIGYMVRWTTAIIKVPVIVRNIVAFENYTNIRFEQQSTNVVNLITNINQKTDKRNIQISEELHHKADANEVQQISEELHHKADANEVQQISEELHHKADANEVQQISEELHHKADANEVQQISEELRHKADANEVQQISEELRHKADANEVQQISEELRHKADANRVEQLNRELALYLQTVNYAKMYLQLVQTNLMKLIKEAEKRLPRALSKDEIKKIIDEKYHIFDAMYVAFEDRFRGTREDIKKRIEIYLPYVKEARTRTKEAQVLDVGCGRGEWLELLKEQRINAKGIDINRIMVAQTKELGLNVEEADVVEYLKSQKDNALLIITGFHIVEHLPFEIMVKLFDESLRALKTGGTVIFETPNPENLMVGAYTFYYDPTHLHPIPPDTLKFVAEARGFTNVKILRLHRRNEQTSAVGDPLHELMERMNMEQDYALIGYKG